MTSEISKSDKGHPNRKMGKRQAIYGKVNPNGQQTLKFTSGDLYKSKFQWDNPLYPTDKIIKPVSGKDIKIFINEKIGSAKSFEEYSDNIRVKKKVLFHQQSIPLFQTYPTNWEQSVY